jgi:hypothetical protein
VTDITDSLRPLVVAAATDAAPDPAEARADDPFDAVRHAAADTHEPVLALRLSIRATGAFFAAHPSRLN